MGGPATENSNAAFSSPTAKNNILENLDIAMPTTRLYHRIFSARWRRCPQATLRVHCKSSILDRPPRHVKRKSPRHEAEMASKISSAQCCSLSRSEASFLKSFLFRPAITNCLFQAFACVSEIQIAFLDMRSQPPRSFVMRVRLNKLGYLLLPISRKSGTAKAGASSADKTTTHSQANPVRRGASIA